MKFIKNKILIIAAAILLLVSAVSIVCIYQGQKNILESDLRTHDSCWFNLEERTPYDEFVFSFENQDSGNMILGVGKKNALKELYINNHKIDINKPVDSLSLYFSILEDMEQNRVAESIRSFCQEHKINKETTVIKDLTIDEIKALYTYIQNSKGQF